MNRLRHAYLQIEPGLEPYFTSGHHDDAPGLAASFLLPRRPGRLGSWGYFLVSTSTVIAAVDAALAAAAVVLAVRQAHAPATTAVLMAAAAFLLAWAALVSWERHTLDPVTRTTPRFPTPPDHPITARRLSLRWRETHRPNPSLPWLECRATALACGSPRDGSSRSKNFWRHCLRVALSRSKSARPMAVPRAPQPPSATSVCRTKVRPVSDGSSAASATTRVI